MDSSAVHRGLDPLVTKLLVAQENVVANWQLDERHRRIAQRMCDRGVARRLSWSVHLLSAAAPTATQLVWAAHLHCGPASMIAGRSAMVLSGWRDVQKCPVHVRVPALGNRAGIHRGYWCTVAGQCP